MSALDRLSVVGSLEVEIGEDDIDIRQSHIGICIQIGRMISCETESRSISDLRLSHSSGVDEESSAKEFIGTDLDPRDDNTEIIRRDKSVFLGSCSEIIFSHSESRKVSGNLVTGSNPSGDDSEIKCPISGNLYIRHDLRQMRLSFHDHGISGT